MDQKSWIKNHGSKIKFSPTPESKNIIIMQKILSGGIHRVDAYYKTYW